MRMVTAKASEKKGEHGKRKVLSVHIKRIGNGVHVRTEREHPKMSKSAMRAAMTTGYPQEPIENDENSEMAFDNHEALAAHLKDAFEHMGEKGEPEMATGKKPANGAPDTEAGEPDGDVDDEE